MKQILRGAVGSTITLVLLAASGAVAGAQPLAPSLDRSAVVSAAGNVGTVARTDDGQPVTTAAVAAEVEEFWTPERMAAAEDLDVVVDAPTDSARQAPAQTGPPGQVEPVSASADSPLRAGDEIQIDGVGTLQLTETPTVGRVFFTTGGSTASCSAATVASAKRRLVMTAGHCVNYNGSWASNWQFVPRYRDGNAPFGAWTAYGFVAPSAWVEDTNYDYDYAIAIMNNNSSNQRIVDVVGGNGLAWNQGYVNYVTIMGYPAGSPYTGQAQVYCQGNTWNGHQQQVRANCDMTGGSSGGPWLLDYDDSLGMGYLNSVVSHRHSDPAQMDGPYFTSTVSSLHSFAEDNTP